MAAHTYRAWLVDHAGLTVWNAQWYGGHHWLGYSVLFAPLAGWPGPAWAGVLASLAAVACFEALAAGPPAWLFAAGVVANVVIGRMPFVLGIALATAAWLCARDERPPRLAGAAALSLAATLASPVAGAFLLLCAVARGGGRRVAALGAPVVAAIAAVTLLFPEGGDDRFVATAFWPMLALSAAGVALLAPRRPLLLGGALYLAVLAGSFLVPNPFGQNALRLGVLLGPALLVLAPRPGAPRAAIGFVLAALLYLQWLPAVRAVAEAGGDRSTQAAFYVGVRPFLERAVRPGERVEVAFTHNHWEVAHLAPAVPLARGWERQLDIKTNPLFYDDAPLTPERYHAWLRENAIRWVALPNADLDYSAEAEARLLRRGAPFLRPAYASRGWRVWEVRDATPPATGGARITAAAPDGFSVRTSGPTVVRQRWTRYWHADGARLSEAPGGWTRVAPERPGPIRVRARFSL